MTRLASASPLPSSSVHPDRALWVLCAIIAFGPLAFGATEDWSKAILSAGLSLSPLILLAGRLSPPPRPAQRAVFIGIGALVGIGILQLAQVRSFDQPATWMPFTHDRWETIRSILLWSSYAAVFYTASRLPDSEASLEKACSFLVALGALLAIIGIAQSMAGNTAYYGLRRIRHGEVFGPYTNKNHAANLMLLSTCAGLGILARARRALRFDRGVGAAADSLAIFFLKALPVAICAAGVVASGSRGAMNAFAAALLVTGVFRWRMSGRRAFLAAFLGMLALYLALLLFHPSLLGVRAGSFDVSSSQRLSMLRDGIAQALDFPLWGSGLGTSMRTFAAYKDPIIVGVVEHIHNDWLENALSVGLAGGTVFAVSMLAWLLSVLKYSALNETSSSRWGMALASTAFLIHSVVEFNLQIPANAAAFFFIAGLLSWRMKDENTTPSAPLRAGWAIAGLIALLPLSSEVARLRIRTTQDPAARLSILESIPAAIRTTRLRRESAYTMVTAADAGPDKAVIRRGVVASQALVRRNPSSIIDLSLLKAGLWRLDRRADAASLELRP